MAALIFCTLVVAETLLLGWLLYAGLLIRARRTVPELWPPGFRFWVVGWLGLDGSTQTVWLPYRPFSFAVYMLTWAFAAVTLAGFLGMLVVLLRRKRRRARQQHRASECQCCAITSDGQ